MKTTLEIPDDLFRATKASAASRGESLKKYVCDALEERLRRDDDVSSQEPGWRKVFGRALSDEVREIETILESEFEQVDPEDWR